MLQNSLNQWSLGIVFVVLVVYVFGCVFVLSMFVSSFVVSLFVCLSKTMYPFDFCTFFLDFLILVYCLVDKIFK